jgi:ribonuclease T1
MPGTPVATEFRDAAVEDHAMRKAGMLGTGKNSNQVYSIDIDSLPQEARDTIKLIAAGGPFPYPGKDGSPFGNKYGDLPSGTYLEYTVPTPGVANRGARRIVARKTTGMIFFTAAHYERVHVTGGGTKVAKDAEAARVAATVDAEWKNGFYVVTGMTADLRTQLRVAITGA